MNNAAEYDSIQREYELLYIQGKIDREKKKQLRTVCMGV